MYWFIHDTMMTMAIMVFDEVVPAGRSGISVDAMLAHCFEMSMLNVLVMKRNCELATSFLGGGM